MGGQKPKNPRRRRALPAADPIPSPPLETPVGRTAGRSETDPGPGDPSVPPTVRPPDRSPTFVPSYCERYNDVGLCINHRPDHVVGRDHVAQLERFLATLGLRNARQCIHAYKVIPADQVAAELDWELAQGLDPMEGANNPGAVIHWRIRERAKELGLWQDPRDAHRDPAEIAARAAAPHRRRP